jgi:hypothetical protein
MENREVNQEEFFVTMCLCEPAIPPMPRVHWIKTKVAFKDHGNYKFSHVVP